MLSSTVYELSLQYTVLKHMAMLVKKMQTVADTVGKIKNVEYYVYLFQ